MARRSRVTTGGDETELNMTPMLDVVFILLIFFIVTSKFIKTPGVDVFKPVAETAQDYEPGMMIAVTSDDEIWIDNVPYSIQEIRPVVLAMRDENPKAKMIIQGDKGAKAGLVMKVQDLMQDLRIETFVSTD